ncbi:MAG: biopolymer transporter ExbD [Treponema sp.]|nr:biopolymer transporter ExbD [Spirochaetia bacterium]MDD7579678.1 biopolymer transporter ExbD [Treponema sp.]MDY3759039.1 biopolymer transporter ExbD [Treponema sp.]MDY4130542.1 biopolymer transporter ExbD [Treponema sp.]MDY5838026.1 biopolymer transporter ExbD [Treponema sp.]
MKKYFKKEKNFVSINITSLIDVVFMLVIFFMLSSSFNKSSIPISLPSSENSIQSSDTESIRVTISKEKIIFLNDSITSIKNLSSESQKLLTSLGTRNAVLYSDENVSLGFMISVIDELTKSGIENVSVKTYAKSKN